MGLLPAGFTKHIEISPTQLNHYSKPAVIWVAVAVVVNQLWGKSVLILYALGSAVLVYIKLGPDFPLMKMLEGKTIVIVGMLLSNSYFKMVNPYWLGAYAGFCMVVRDWDIMSMIHRVEGLNQTLNGNNETLKKTNEDLLAQLIHARDGFKELLKQAKRTDESRDAARDAEKKMHDTAEQKKETFGSALKEIEAMVQEIVSDEAFSQRMDELERIRKGAEEIHLQNVQLNTKQDVLLANLTQLEGRVKVLVESLGQQQGQYQEQVSQVQEALGQLKQKLSPGPS